MNNPNDSELHARLLAIADDLFIKDNRIYKAIDMQGHGSDFDDLISKDVDDPKYAIQVAAWRLHELLRGKCTNGEPHYMIDIPAHKRCRDCGYGRR